MANNILPSKRKLFELESSLILNHSKFWERNTELEKIKLKILLNMIHATLNNIHLYLQHLWGAVGERWGITKTALLQVGINVEVSQIFSYTSKTTTLH